MAGEFDPKTSALLGGSQGLIESDASRRGVYAVNPAAQLKYSTAWDKSVETQARLFVDMGSTVFEKFVATFPLQAQPYIRQVCGGMGYIDFLLHNVSESHEENVQVTELLSDDYVAYFFGQKPRVYQYAGSFLNTYQDDWWKAFQLLYTELLRGSKLAEFGKLVSLRYDSKIVHGALMNFSASHTSEMQMTASFNFNLLVKRVDIVPPLQGDRSSPPATALSTPAYSLVSNQKEIQAALASPTLRYPTDQITASAVEAPRQKATAVITPKPVDAAVPPAPAQNDVNLAANAKDSDVRDAQQDADRAAELDFYGNITF